MIFLSIFQSKSGSPLADLLATNTAVAISVFNEILSEVYVTSGKIQGALLDTFEYLERLRTSGLNASHWEGSQLALGCLAFFMASEDRGDWVAVVACRVDVLANLNKFFLEMTAGLNKKIQSINYFFRYGKTYTLTSRRRCRSPDWKIKSQQTYSVGRCKD